VTFDFIQCMKRTLNDEENASGDDEKIDDSLKEVAPVPSDVSCIMCLLPRGGLFSFMQKCLVMNLQE